MRLLIWVNSFVTFPVAWPDYHGKPVSTVLTEPLLNNLEVVVWACDLCLSRATYAVGRMSLQLELLDVKGKLVDNTISTRALLKLLRCR